MSNPSCTLDTTVDCPALQTDGDAAWGAVVSLSLGVFALVTAEFLPISLLTPIAADLGISNGAAGQAVTATAVVGAIAAPAVVIGTAKIDRRLVVWGLSLLLVFSNLLAAIASDIWILLAARIGVGIGLGGIWALAAALALRLVPARLMPRAMSIIFTGMTAATVCAPALGAYLGDILGWRATFLAAAGIGALALLAQLVTLPSLPPMTPPSFGTFLQLMYLPRVRVGLIMVLLVISGHFAGLTYVRPFLEQVPKMDVEMLSLALLALGVGGFFGNLAGGFLAERSAKLAVCLAALMLAAMTLGLLVYGASPNLAFAATAAWGVAFGAFPVGIQTWTTQAAPDHAESAGALLVSTFQVAIASGAIVGGILVDGYGAPGAIASCSIAALAGGLVMAFLGRSDDRRSN